MKIIRQEENEEGSILHPLLSVLCENDQQHFSLLSHKLLLFQPYHTIHFTLTIVRFRVLKIIFFLSWETKTQLNFEEFVSKQEQHKQTLSTIILLVFTVRTIGTASISDQWSDPISNRNEKTSNIGGWGINAN